MVCAVASTGRTRFKQPIRGRASIEVGAPPQVVYGLISDITRMGEWSPECTGGKWLGSATRPAVGARFKGTNKNRFSWSTSSRVVVADENREFAFDRDRPRGFGVMRWSYLFEPVPGGTRVTESFEQVRTAPMLAIRAANLTTGVPWNEREAVNVANMETTLQRLKATAEQLAAAD
jgi:hypothetical protein